jgi:hypothetical protein
VRCLALIGDICDSRNLPANERAALQRTLERQFGNLNKAHAANLLSPLTLTLGDEFQALLSGADELWHLLATLQAALDPVRARFGLGLGEIVTGINREAALGMDGPAFHRARDAVSTLKQEGGYFRVEGLTDEDLINPALALISDAQGKWRPTRFRVFRDHLHGIPVEQSARALGVSRVAVYKNINDGLFHPTLDILNAISRRMNASLATDDEQ